MEWNQKSICEWQAKTFPDASVDSVLEHLKSEIEELDDAAYLEQGAVEAADCACLLFAYAGLTGFDLMEEINKKMNINVKRKWGKKNSAGFHEHIKDGG